MKILFLDTGFDEMDEIFRKYRSKYGCDSFCLYKTNNKNIIFRMIQFLGINFFSLILFLIYGNWKYKINNYDLIILPSRKSSKYAVDIIKKKYHKRVVVWYWNIVTKNELSPSYCKRKGCETWSFDKEDCKKYGMMFGDTYYFDDFYVNSDSKKTDDKYSMFYVGINRPGRNKILNDLKNVLNNNNLKYKFVLTSYPNDSKKLKKQFDIRLKYSEVVYYINNSSSVLDLNRNNQSGLTLRPLEALFYGKKLITNNVFIKDYMIYNNKNIYIIGEEEQDLITFLKKDFVAPCEKLKDYYLFKSWLNRLINKEEGF